MGTDPTLLIGFLPEPSEAAILAEALPTTRWVSGVASRAAEWGSIEALLIGNLHRELPNWGPRDTPSLRFVQCLHTGLDTFPFERFAPSIWIAGNGGAYAPFVAERAIALLLEAGHHLAANHAAVRAGTLRPAPANRFLVGSRVLILGFGAIGQEVARRAIAGGATVDAVTRDGRAIDGIELVFPAAALERAVSGADAIVDCRPLTARTRATIDARVLAAMRPDACFVNVGRAGTVDRSALRARLQSTPTFTAAVDVWWTEDYANGRLAEGPEFGDLPNFLGTPHNAAIGPGARARGFQTAVANLRRFFAGERPRSIADRDEYR